MIEKIFPATDEALEDAMAFVEEELERLDCPQDMVWKISLCVEEMFVNVAHYAYDGEGDGFVTLTIDDANNAVTITFTDEGKPFDPLAKEDPDISLPVEQRGIGGLGIFIVKKSMDEVSYDYRDGKNVFTMKKSIR